MLHCGLILIRIRKYCLAPKQTVMCSWKKTNCVTVAACAEFECRKHKKADAKKRRDIQVLDKRLLCKFNCLLWIQVLNFEHWMITKITFLTGMLNNRLILRFCIKKNSIHHTIEFCLCFNNMLKYFLLLKSNKFRHSFCIHFRPYLLDCKWNYYELKIWF